VEKGLGESHQGFEFPLHWGKRLGEPIGHFLVRAREKKKKNGENQQIDRPSPAQLDSFIF